MTAAVVTCGGLCPGLNDVVQNIVYTLDDYGVPEDQVGRRAGGAHHLLCTLRRPGLCVGRHARPVCSGMLLRSVWRQCMRETMLWFIRIHFWPGCARRSLASGTGCAASWTGMPSRCS